MEFNGWTVKVRRPENPGANSRVMLLVHGWTGDESSMWIFTHKVPQDAWLFAPRGTLALPSGGYSWLQHDGKNLDVWPNLEAFRAPAEALMEAFNEWRQQEGAPLTAFDAMGFSQGAAIAYTLGAFFPEQVHRVIALAGRLPEDPAGGAGYQAYQGKQVYVAHGTADDRIPVQYAQEAVRTLQAQGAEVTYCESDVGHKLSASCLRGLEVFLKE